MAAGPGKYDEMCVKALVETEATCVVLIVLGGKDGSGFSVNSIDASVPDLLPKMLRQVADQIEGD